MPVKARSSICSSSGAAHSRFIRRVKVTCLGLACPITMRLTDVALRPMSAANCAPVN
jgi:hypothetical protein